MGLLSLAGGTAHGEGVGALGDPPHHTVAGGARQRPFHQRRRIGWVRCGLGAGSRRPQRLSEELRASCYVIQRCWMEDFLFKKSE